MVVTFERGASEAGGCIGEGNLDERGTAHEAAAPNGRKGGWQGELPQRGGAQEGVAAEAGEGGGQGELRERGAFGEGFVNRSCPAEPEHSHLEYELCRRQSSSYTAIMPTGKGNSAILAYDRTGHGVGQADAVFSVIVTVGEE